MQFESLLPPIGERVFFTGQTGSGKTTLARYLLAYREFVVVYDGKGQIKWPGYEIHSTLKNTIESESKKIIYQPSWEELHDETYANRFFEWIYRRQNTTLYIDEIFTITIGNELPEYYHACLTRGRELGISVWSSSQRPKSIPQVVLSESENAFMFRLSLAQDRDRIESLYMIDSDKLADLDKRFFYAAKDNGSVINGPYKLKLL